MQSQSSKNIYNGPQNRVNNITAQTRANQTSTGSTVRQNISNLTPRNGYGPSTAMFPAVNSSVVMGQFNASYTTCPPSLQPCQYAPQYYPHVYYPYYVPQLTQQQQPQQSASGNSLMGLNSILAVQPGGFISAPVTATNRPTMSFPVTPRSTVFNVVNTNSEPTVCMAPRQQPPTSLSFGLTSVTTSSILGPTSTTSVQTFNVAAIQHNQTCMPFISTPITAGTQIAATQQNQSHTKVKLRSHALQIIHPVTNKNILQDFNKGVDKVSRLETEIGTLRTSSPSQVVQQKPTISKSVEIMQNTGSMTPKRSFKDATQQAEQTSITSTMMHCPSVEVIGTCSKKPDNKLDQQTDKATTTNTKHFKWTQKKAAQEIKQQDIVGERDVNLNECKENKARQSKTIANMSEVEHQDKYINESYTIEEKGKENNNTDVEDEDINNELEGVKSEGTDYDVKVLSQVDLGNVNGNETVLRMTTTNDETSTQITFFNRTFKNRNDCKENLETSLSPTNRKQYTRKQLMQLRQTKDSCMQPNVKNTSIFAPIYLMPNFATRGHRKMEPTVSRNRAVTSNAQNTKSSITNRDAVAIAGTKTLASGHNNRNMGKPIIYLNLSLKKDIKLNEADNAWRPTVLLEASNASQSNTQLNEQTERDELIRRVRGILNKLTPEKFEPLVEEIIKLKIDTMEKMEAVMNLVFEKAIDEPNFSVSYAKLCHRLISEVKAHDERMESSTKSNLAYFRKALLDKTESEFTHNVIKINAKEEKLKPIRERLANCQDTNEKIELEALLNEEERKIRRRSGGTVRFIGELFKISILSGRIINSCIEALLKNPNNEDMLECLCKLLTTVGQKIEQIPLFPDDKHKYSLKSVIQRMQNIASKTGNSKISSRVRFMLLDVIDLRKKKWQSTRNEAPKTMEQIEKEINSAVLGNRDSKRDDQKCQHGSMVSVLSNQSTCANTLPNSLLDTSKSLKLAHVGTGKRNDRRRGEIPRDTNYTQRNATCSTKYPEMGKSTNNSKWQIQTSKANCSGAVDTNKLIGLSAVDLNNKKMGGVSLFQWRKLSSQTTTQQKSNSFAALSLDANKCSNYEHKDDGNRFNSRLKNPLNNEHNRLHPPTDGKETQRKIVQNQKSISRDKCQREMLTPLKSSIMSTKMSLSQSQDDFVTSHSETHQCTTVKPLAVFIEPNKTHLKLMKAMITEMTENAASSKCIDNSTVSCINELPENLRCAILYYILTDYLHLANVKPLTRRHLSNIIAYLIEKQIITIEHFQLAYKNFANLASDLIVDIPELWLYIFEFTGPLMVKNLLTINDLWSRQLRDSGPPQFSEKFLKSFVQYGTREIGPNFIRSIWKKFHMKWTDYLDERVVEDFIKSNCFEYVENENSPIIYDSKRGSQEICHLRVMDHIKQMLNEGLNSDQIIDYIHGNIKDIDNAFIKNLTSTLISFAIKDSNHYSLDVHRFQYICLPVLRRYLDSKDDFELECLCAIQLVVHDLEHPKDLLEIICFELSDADIIAEETFLAWHNKKKQCEKCSITSVVFK